MNHLFVLEISVNVQNAASGLLGFLNL